MTEKERAAANALHEAMNAIQRAMLACGDADLSFMNTVEPLMGAHECVAQVAKTVNGTN